MDRVVVVAVCGEVDALTAPRLLAAITAAMAATPVGVIVDLSQVSFLAAAGLSVLLDTHGWMTPNIGFRVVASGVAARRPITLLELDGVLALSPTVDSAVRNLAKHRP